MKLASWNINSLRARIEQLKDFLIEVNPDILLLQEIKCENEKFPYEELKDFPYNIFINGQKSYHGVAILSKFPATQVKTEFPTIRNLNQARMIEVQLDTPIGLCTVISLYAPNGSDVYSDKFLMKLNFYDDLIKYLLDFLHKSKIVEGFVGKAKPSNAECIDVREERRQALTRESPTSLASPGSLLSKHVLDSKIIVAGDFNIAPFDIDVYSPSDLRNTTCFTEDEQKKFRTLVNGGYEDLYRLLHPETQEFSWWDYRAGNWEKNKGMRIDMVLASSGVTNYVSSCSIESSWRTKHKPSDHAPIIVTFDLNRPRQIKS